MADNNGLFMAIIAFNVFALVLLSLSMILRLFTRIRVSKRTGWEDWTICVAFLLFLSSLALGPKSMTLGLLKPVDQISLENGIALNKLSHANEILYPATMAFIKISILLQMTRIFIPLHQTKSFYFTVAFGAINTLWFIAIFFVSVFQCIPVSRVWDARIAGHCLDYSIWIVIAGAFNMISDCIMLALPMLWIARLQMDIKRKLTAAAVFVIGVLACTASIVRFIFSLKHLQGGTKPGTSSLIAVAACTSGEAAAGILCANLPNLPAFIKHFKGRSERSKTQGKGAEWLPRSDSNGSRKKLASSKSGGMIFLTEAVLEARTAEPPEESVAAPVGLPLEPRQTGTVGPCALPELAFMREPKTKNEGWFSNEGLG